MKISTADFLFFARGPDLQAKRCPVMAFVRLERKSRERCVSRRPRTCFGDQFIALFLQGSGQILPCDCMEDNMCVAIEEAFETFGKPVDSIGLVDTEAR